MGIRTPPFLLASEQPYFRGNKRRKIADPLRLAGVSGVRQLERLFVFDRSTQVIEPIAGRKLGCLSYRFKVFVILYEAGEVVRRQTRIRRPGL